MSPQFNDEHKDAFHWLNKNSREGIDLFSIRLEVWRIAESPPAVRLNPVEDPSEGKEKTKRSEGEVSETKKLQEEYWTQFRDLITERVTPLRARKPNPSTGTITQSDVPVSSSSSPSILSKVICIAR